MIQLILLLLVALAILLLLKMAKSTKSQKATLEEARTLGLQEASLHKKRRISKNPKEIKEN